MPEASKKTAPAWYALNRMLKNRVLTMTASKERPAQNGQMVHEADEKTLRFDWGFYCAETDAEQKFLDGHKYLGHPNPQYGFRKLSDMEVQFLDSRLINRKVDRKQWHARLKKYTEALGDESTTA
jgi:hypothetical protein